MSTGAPWLLLSSKMVNRRPKDGLKRMKRTGGLNGSFSPTNHHCFTVPFVQPRLMIIFNRTRQLIGGVEAVPVRMGLQLVYN